MKLCDVKPMIIFLQNINCKGKEIEKEFNILKLRA